MIDEIKESYTIREICYPFSDIGMMLYFCGGAG